MKKNTDYNTRLFSTGIRRWIHISRFIWLKHVLDKFEIHYSNVVELGCFDGRSINYLCGFDSYLGYDAGWENGLNSATKKFALDKSINFKLCNSPSDFDLHLYGNIDLCISLETLEHIDAAELENYLFIISKNLKGHFIVTVPNEKGILFFLKYLLKKFIGGSEKYSFIEFVYATIGQCERINQDNHKGFDYDKLESILSKYFKILYSSGVQFKLLPKCFNTQIGFVLKSH
jgi:hypothetical protein